MKRPLPFLLALLVAGGLAGCGSGSGGGSSVGTYYGSGWSGPWYYNDHYHYDDGVPVSPPPRPDRPPLAGRPPHPAHLPAYGAGRPAQQPGISAAPRPSPSIPSRPRGGGGRGGGRR